MPITKTLSVIVPVYGVEKYLVESLDSILVSTFKNFELILVDDGSCDTCAEICDYYAYKDDRILVIHQINQGLSGARNTGMMFASGEVISFIDSDDKITPDFFSKMLLPIQTENADIVCCGMTILNNGLSYLPHPEQPRIYPDGSGILALLEKNGTQDFMMNKVYKKELLEGVQFPEGKAYEDIFIQHRIFSKSKKTAFLNCSLYLYRFNESGITHGKQFKPHMMDFVEACREQLEFTAQNYPKFVPVATAKYLNSIRIIAWYQYRNNKTKTRKKNLCALSGFAKAQSYAQNPYISSLLQIELNRLQKGYGAWSRYCKKAEWVARLHNHPRYQKLFARFFNIPLDLPKREDQY